MTYGDDDWDDDDLDDYPEDMDEAGTIPCPNCGAEIYEESPQCPVCGEYVTRRSGRVWDGKPYWYILLGLCGIIAVTCILLIS